MSRLERIRNVDLRGRLRQEGVLDFVNRRHAAEVEAKIRGDEQQ